MKPNASIIFETGNGEKQLYLFLTTNQNVFITYCIPTAFYRPLFLHF